MMAVNGRIRIDMKLSESPIVHFVRSITLLATLIAVPGIAVFWNHLPKNPVSHPAPLPAAPVTEESFFFHEDSRESAAPVISPPTPKVASDAAIQQVSWEQSQPTPPPPQDFAALERHLKALGATYYRLEKWGNRGELFRFSCFVTSSEPYSYEKHFQAIGTDTAAVMRSVIADIETWKNAR